MRRLGKPSGFDTSLNSQKTRPWRRFLAGFLLFFTGSFQVSAAPREQELRVHIVGELQTLDWHAAGTAIEGGILHNLMDGLFQIDARNELEPSLVSSHRVSEDGLTYTFELRRNVRWSDGVEFQAQQVVDGWKRLLDPKKKHRYAYLLFDIESARSYSLGRLKDFSEVGVRALGKHTLEVRLKGRRPHWLLNLTLWPTFPIRQDLIRRHGELNWLKPGRLVTLGAFSLKEIRLRTRKDARDQVMLERNRWHSLAGQGVERLLLQIGSLGEREIADFKTGRTDFVPFVYPGELREDQGLQELLKIGSLQRMPSARIIHLNFNTVRGPASDAAFRKALTQAIDKESFHAILKWGYQPLHSFSPRGWIGQAREPEVRFNLKQAQSSLKKAAVALKSPWHTLQLAVLQAPDTLMVASELAEQFRRHLGIEVKLTEIPPSKVGEAIRSTQRYDLWLFSVSAKHPEPEYFYSLFASDSGNNQTGFHNSSYDNLLQAVRTDPSTERRDHYYREISRILVAQEVVAFPLFQDARSALVSPSISGLQRSIFRPLDFRNVQRSPASTPRGVPPQTTP
jgi:oligopeptide transport system substrate-binding protein